MRTNPLQYTQQLISAFTPKAKNYPLYVRVPDSNGNFTRVLRRHKFRDTNKVFYLEPKFWLHDGRIVRKDGLFEAEDVVGLQSAGFQPTKLADYREYCRNNYHQYKEQEIFINPFAIMAGMKEPAYDDKAVTSPKYHL